MLFTEGSEGDKLLTESDCNDDLGLSTRPGEYIEVELKDICHEKYKTSTQAAHCMFFAEKKTPVLKVYNPRALVFMQLRFDGHLGFPGGAVDLGETPKDAVNRELVEEIGITPGFILVKDEELCCIHYSQDKDLLLFFYVKELPIKKMVQVQRKSVFCEEYGNEVMGVLQVPLYTMSDGFRGFPAFLRSTFIGNSKEQLFQGLQMKNLMTRTEINKALLANPTYVRPKTSKKHLISEENC